MAAQPRQGRTRFRQGVVRQGRRMTVTLEAAAGDPQWIIADLKRELAARTAERDEAVAQQTATGEILQVINSSPGDLTPVFEALLDKALTLCGGRLGFIRTF